MFDKKLYNGYKQIVKSQISNMPIVYDGDPLDWITGLIGMFNELVNTEDYEAMKAIKDGIGEHLKEALSGEVSDDMINKYVEILINKELEIKL